MTHCFYWDFIKKTEAVQYKITPLYDHKSIYSKGIPDEARECLRGVVVNVMDCSIVASMFELQSRLFSD